MNRLQRILSRIALGAVVCLLAAGAMLEPTAFNSARAARGHERVAASLAREPDPVVLPGVEVAGLAGAALNELFVYAETAGSLAQIPFQIDERDASGRYTDMEDGLLDANDEIVFMAADAGDWSANPALSVGGAMIYPTYALTITDPLDGGQAWAYLFHSPLLQTSFNQDYVSFDAVSDRIASAGHYSFQFNPTYSFRDTLTLGNSNLDILDRDKLRLAGVCYYGPVPIGLAFDEEDVLKDDVFAIDGPVRVTRVSTSTIMGAQGSGQMFAYRSLVVQPVHLQVPAGPVDPCTSVRVDLARISTDWSPQASGMVYYDANTPSGVTIDGTSDAVAASPVSPWTQVSGAQGSLVYVALLPTGLGGTQTMYYRDDSTYRSDDTGDHLSYGDAGFQVSQPNAGEYTLDARLYFPGPLTGSAGGLFLEYLQNPLQISVQPFLPAAPEWRLALPAIFR